MTAEFWRGRRVFVTGITGFKGSWLALWLRELGATVVGYALPPPTNPALFDLARVRDLVELVEGDIRDLPMLARAVESAKPEVVFHLAAQPLVRESYTSPVATFETNVLGTVHLLEAVLGAKTARAVVVVTTDKCYENREWMWPYRERDALGGHDPYSSSKACAEIATSAYYRSFFRDRGVGVATARAGNVIGGGDWARDRLLPDLVTALLAGEAVTVRSPASVRPWQHVLEPLAGYLTLAERLTKEPAPFSEAWNFGPEPEAVRTVAEVVERACAQWGDGARWSAPGSAQPHEALLLALDSSKARARLGVRPRIGLDRAIDWTVLWYKAFQKGASMRDFSVSQIRLYEEIAR